MVSFNSLAHTRYGKVIYNKNDVYIGKSLEFYGEYSEFEIEFFNQLLKSNIVVLDIGANIGYFTLFFAKKVLPHGIVYAFEPQRLIFYILAGNMALNSITNVHCYQKAVGKEGGKIRVPYLDYTKPNNFGGVSLTFDENGEEVDVITIDSLDLPHCHFMKIDVVGMENDVLLGAEKTIKRFRPILYLECDRADKFRELTATLREFNYDMYQHYPPLYNPNNFYNNPHNIFSNIVSANLFCIPAELGVRVEGLEKV